MKHLTDEQKKIWDMYYSRLNVRQLAAAVVDMYIIAYPTKPGIWAYDYIKSSPLIVKNHTIPGVIWRDGKTGKQRPEPTEEEIDRALDNLWYLPGDDKPGDINRAGLDIIYRRHKNYYKSAEVLERYLSYHPLILKRIYELTEPLLYGPREDVQALAKEYQAGNIDILPRIENQLGGIVYRAQQQFSYIGNKEAFTNLAGKFSKKIPKPDTEYSEDSPAGDTEDQRLMLITEPFKFTEADLQAVIEKAAKQALDSYKFNQGAQLKTWFYKIFEKDLIDLYRKYRHGWKYGHIIKSLAEYQEKLQENKSISDHSFTNIIIEYREQLNRIQSHQDNLNIYLQPGFVKQLTAGQREWINLFFKMLPESLRDNVTAEVLNISTRTERRRRKTLQDLLLNNEQVFKKWKRLIIKDKPARQPIRKQPALSKEQALMLEHYKQFTNNKKPFSINPGEYKYKPGICSGSSFFPFTSVFIEPLEEGRPYYRPLPPVDQWTRARYELKQNRALLERVSYKIDKKQKYRGLNGKEITRYFKRYYYCRGHKEILKEKEFKFKTMYSDINIKKIKRRQTDQTIKQPELYCRCGIILTVTGECSKTVECPLLSNNLLYSLKNKYLVFAGLI